MTTLKGPLQAEVRKAGDQSGDGDGIEEMVVLQGGLPESDPFEERDEHTGAHHGKAEKSLEH